MGTKQDIKVFLTAEHNCGYWPERIAQDLVLDPADLALPNMYERTLAMGFRRSGGHVYRPHCKSCRECIPVRLPVKKFKLSRSHKRCLTRNSDLQFRTASVTSGTAHFNLYQRYINSRHSGGPMDQPTIESYQQFLSCHWSPTKFFEVRREQKLIAVAVTDVCDSSLSAVYTFFDPEHAERSLGTFCILKQIEWAIQTGREYLYLGFWLKDHPKMAYKKTFSPLEKLEGVRWVNAK